MLTLDDCIAMSELSEEMVEAIAAHEHLPCIVAAELGRDLICSAQGCVTIGRILMAEIAKAEEVADRERAAKLAALLSRFVANKAPLAAAAE